MVKCLLRCVARVWTLASLARVSVPPRNRLRPSSAHAKLHPVSRSFFSRGLKWQSNGSRVWSIFFVFVRVMHAACRLSRLHMCISAYCRTARAVSGRPTVLDSAFWVQKMISGCNELEVSPTLSTQSCLLKHCGRIEVFHGSQ
jgi:hypothetical protein